MTIKDFLDRQRTSTIKGAEWRAQVQEEALEPDLPIVDAHHHLWDHPGARYLLDEYCEDLATGHNIVASVFVQGRAMHRRLGPEPLCPIGETEFANGVAAMSASGLYGDARVCDAIVAYADLRLGAVVDDVLAAHRRAAPERMRGIRQISAWDSDPATAGPGNCLTPNLLSDPSFLEGFAKLQAHALSFDAWLLAPQIPELTVLARRFPETVIVLDHAGTPLGVGGYAGRRAELFDSWRSDIRELSACSNVRVKLGGLGQRVNGYDWTDRRRPPGSDELAAAWKPYVETCIDAFSPTRCMFESNFPVDRMSFSYGIFWNAAKKLTSRYSAEDRAALFSGTAARTYRIVDVI